MNCHNSKLKFICGAAQNKLFGGHKQNNVTPGEGNLYRIHVVTGDRRGAGTDANVYLTFFDTSGNKSKIIQPKTNFLKNDHERGSTTTIDVSADDIGISPPFDSIEIWRDNFGNVPSYLGYITEHLFGGSDKSGSAAWFLDRVELELLSSDVADNAQTSKGTFISYIEESNSKVVSLSSSACENKKYVFPVQRWIDADTCYKYQQFDCILPFNETRMASRKAELQRKREQYYYIQNIDKGPSQV